MTSDPNFQNQTRVRPFVSAVATLPAFVALAILQTWPLARHLDTHLPGLGLGDNVSFAWNVWWMREALASADWSFFSTPLLMAPLGLEVGWIAQAEPFQRSTSVKSVPAPFL